MTEQESRRASNRSVNLFWKTTGDPSATPVLLIAGLAASSRSWERLAPSLSGAGAGSLRPILFDNRGTGRSDRPPGPYSMDELVGDALAVLDAAGVERTHVVGHSMGGMIAQNLALAHPGRVDRLVLLSTHAGGQVRSRVAFRWTLSLALRPLVGPGRTFWITAPLAYAERTRRERPELLHEDRRRRFEDDTPTRTVNSQLAAARSHDLRERLGELGAPTLVIHGREDGVIPLELGEDLARRIAGAQLVLLDDCGHAVGSEAPERAAVLITKFLSEEKAIA